MGTVRADSGRIFGNEADALFVTPAVTGFSFRDRDSKRLIGRKNQFMTAFRAAIDQALAIMS